MGIRTMGDTGKIGVKDAAASAGARLSGPVVAVIPAYNEEDTVGDVIRATLAHVDRVLVVDDGSADKTGEAARRAGADVVRHLVNRGLGAALGTGFEGARRLSAAVAVTLDADGQHDPGEIPALLAAIAGGADVVVGSRMLAPRGMPWHRRLANRVGNFVTFVLFRARVTDSQSGFRAFSRRALGEISVRSRRMEVSSELVAESRRHGLRLAEVPIRAIYSEYSLSKGQSMHTGVQTLAALLFRRISRRY